MPTTNGPLTTIFSPPAACLTDVYQYASGSTGVAYLTHDNISPCYPPAFTPFYASIYSPAICPSGYTYTFCSDNLSTTNSGVTTAHCCPSNWKCARPTSSTGKLASDLNEAAALDACYTVLTKDTPVTYSSPSRSTGILPSGILVRAYRVDVQWAQSDLSRFQTLPPGATVSGSTTAPRTSTPGTTTSSAGSSTGSSGSSSDNNSGQGSASGGGLSTGAKIGIGLGVPLGAIFVGFALFCCFVLKRRKTTGLQSSQSPNYQGAEKTISEVPGDHQYVPQGQHGWQQHGFGVAQAPVEIGQNPYATTVPELATGLEIAHAAPNSSTLSTSTEQIFVSPSPQTSAGPQEYSYWGPSPQEPYYPPGAAPSTVQPAPYPPSELQSSPTPALVPATSPAEQQEAQLRLIRQKKARIMELEQLEADRRERLRLMEELEEQERKLEQSRAQASS